ncbi:MAG: adenylate/guanylate cyclase domain-containing protein [Limibacillus sp.]
MSFRILHPLYEAASLIWTDEGIGNQLHLQGGETREQWQRSPLHLLHSNQLPFLRRRLVGRNAQLDFPLLQDLKETGGTDYLCLGVPFQSDWNEGVLSSWLTDRPRGFTDGHLRDIRSVMQPLAYALKSRIERQIAENIASAYLGRTAGERVLSGAIRRGDGERISGALWYSDLRGSTALAERLTPEDFLAALNAYFDRSAQAILEQGGEVISYIGDGVLGFFPDSEDPASACKQALAAAKKAAPALGQGSRGEQPFTVALHYGSFIYGNIGTADRLQFTAIGSSINELARIQDLTKSLGEPLLASGPFTEKAGGDWRGLGEHKVRGLDHALPLFTL